MKLHLAKSISAAMIMTILALSIISTGNFLVSADPGGIGKYVTLSFEGADPKYPDFYVTATKEASGQFWIYPDPITEEMTQKLGAGSIVLVATHPLGYSVSWKLGLEADAPVIENEDSIVFRSEKYAEIIVIFSLSQYEVTFYQNGLDDDAAGTILTVNGDAQEYSDFPVRLPVKYGDTINYVFTDPVSGGVGKRFVKTGEIIGPASPFDVTGDTVVTATYKTQYEVTFSVDPNGAGETTPAKGTYWYDEDSLIEITATENAGYYFSSWGSPGIEIVDASLPSTTATINQPGTITAIFQQGYTLTITNLQPDWGYWSLDDYEPYYQEGEEVTIYFYAYNDDEYHLSSVLDNNEFADLIETELAIMYTITFHEDHNVIVAFDPVGVATVPAGSAVTVFLRNSFGVGSLFFTGTYEGGIAAGGALPIVVGDGTSAIFWEVSAGNWAFEDGNYVIIAIPLYGVDPPDHIYTADERDALWSDVNGDGEITQDDMVEVAIAISSNGREYDPKYDTNGDGHLNQKDVHTVMDYVGTSLTEIMEVEYNPDGFASPPPPALWMYDATHDLILIQTDHFSIFRGR